MSHFYVLVVGEDVDLQLAPYQENNMGDCPKEYLEFDEVEEDFEAEYQEDDGGFPNLDEYVKENYGYEKSPETGKYGTWENPNAKWDWYQVGGRWSDTLRLKDGTYCDSAKKGEVDFDGQKREYEKKAGDYYDFCHNSVDLSGHLESWGSVRERVEDIDQAREIYHDQRILKGLKDFAHSLPRENSYRSKIIFDFEIEDVIVKSREEYIKENSNGVAPYAFVKDGKWYQKGEMGWFGMSSDEKDHKTWDEEFFAMFNSLPDDTVLTVVDCHI